jgi:hypothetical protein
MGESLHAKCENCQFTKTVFFGGTESNHLIHFSFPAIDNETGQLVNKNYFEKDTMEGQYVFYNNPSMFRSTNNQRFTEWKGEKLMLTDNFCPNCKQFTMKFKLGMVFD